MGAAQITSIKIKAASPHECGKVALLLKAAGLPIHDIDPNLPGFLVAYDDNKLVGTIGIERYGSVGLLRSLAVDKTYRNRKVGQQLYDEAIAYAELQGIRRLFLLTVTATDYFAKRGFQAISRENVPNEIQQTEQFSSICPSSATVMQLVL